MNKVLTANRLTDGIAVWLAADGRWTETIDRALVARHAEAVAALEEIGEVSFHGNQVVEIAVVDVEEIDGSIVPLRMREKIRAAGPTIRSGPGKRPGQATSLVA